MAALKTKTRIGNWRRSFWAASKDIVDEAGSLLRRKTYWIAFIIVGVIISLTGSFDTDRIESISARTMFVVALMLVSVFGCAILSGLYRNVTGASAIHRFDAVIKVGLLWVPCAAVPGRVALEQLSGGEVTLSLMLRSVVHGVAIALLVVAILYLLKFSRDLAKSRILIGEILASASPANVPLPTNNNKSVPNYIESDDHYLKIVRDCGVEFVRANLGEVADGFGSFGMRCHRSYWVSRSAIDRRRRQGRQMLLVLKDGTEIPVGRSYEKAVRLSLEVFAA